MLAGTTTHAASKRPLERDEREGGRLDVISLRARLRGHYAREQAHPVGIVRRTYERARKCGVCRRTAAELVVLDGGALRGARWSGMVTCQSIHACPVCALRIRTKRASQVRAAVEEGRRQNPKHRWRMLTVTIRHDSGLPLKPLRRLVMGAWRRARQRGTVQRVWKAKVRGSVRAVEVTHGGNGWHPHLHLLVLTEGWTGAELAALESAWTDAVRAESARLNLSFSRVEPQRGIALRWSSVRATEKEIDRSGYLAKLGWEMTGAGKGEPQWRIATRAAQGDRRAAELWAEYVEAMAGVRAIECDERAAGYAKTHAELESLGTDADATLGPREVRVEIGAFRLLTMRDAERRRPTVTRDILLAAARAGPHEDAILAAFDAECRAALTGNASPPADNGASLAA